MKYHRNKCVKEQTAIFDMAHNNDRKVSSIYCCCSKAASVEWSVDSIATSIEKTHTGTQEEIEESPGVMHCEEEQRPSIIDGLGNRFCVGLFASLLDEKYQSTGKVMG